MPYVTCPQCGVSTYLVTHDECPRCGRMLAARTSAAVEHALQLARRELDADLALLSEIHDGHETVRFAVGNGAIPALRPGVSALLEDTICRHLLEGRIDSLVPDITENEHLRDLTAVLNGGIRAYVGVAITAADARRYVLCCLACEARPDLGEADVRFLQGLTASLELTDALSAC